MLHTVYPPIFKSGNYRVFRKDLNSISHKVLAAKWFYLAALYLIIIFTWGVRQLLFI